MTIKRLLVYMLLPVFVTIFIAVLLMQTSLREPVVQELQQLALKYAHVLPLAQIGSVLFNRHCASCHDDAASKAPRRAALAQLSKDNILVTLEFGKMQPFAAHLSKQEKGLIAIYLAGEDKDVYEWLTKASCKKKDARPFGEQSVLIANWGAGLHNRRFIDDETALLDKESVASLALRWSFAFAKTTDVRSQPVVTDDTIYIGDKAGMLYAIDRRMGCVRNHYKAIAGIRSAISHVKLQNGRDLLVFADSLATVFALDPDTFEVVWRKSVGLFETSVVTGSISSYANRLYVPVSSYEVAAAGMANYPCCKSHGAVVSLDAASGETVWVWHATSDAERQTPNKAGIEQFGPSGAVVWTTPLIDVQRNRLYVGTGQNLSLPATDTSDSVIAIDLSSGHQLWVFQSLANDVWNSACQNGGPNCPPHSGPDFDFGASMVLADIGNGKQLLLAGQKSGDVYALDPDVAGTSGRVIWHNRISQGSTNGGVHWGMALSGDTLLVPIADPERDIAGYVPKPGLYALDVRNGKERWVRPVERNCDFDMVNAPKVGLAHMREGGQLDLQTRYKCPYYYGLSAAPMATSQVVFSGGLDGRMRAFDISNGELLWQYATAVPVDAVNDVEGHGGAIDVAGQVVAGGWLYVLSGYSMFGQLPGNVLFAFSP